MLMSMIFGYMAGLTAYILKLIILAFDSPGEERDPDEDYTFLDTIIDVEKYIVTIGHFLPTFNLSLALNKIQNRQLISILKKMGQEVLTAWDPEIARNEIYWLIYSIPGYFALVLLIQFVTDSPRFSGSLLNLFQRNVNSYSEIIDMDDDVCEEDRKCSALVNGEGRSNYPPVLVKDLKKQYGLFNRCSGVPKLAVRGVSFTVEPGMCFGLLGVNGAGKTSTLGMITGEFPPSAGEAWLAQRSIMGQANEVKVREGGDDERSESRKGFIFCLVL